jgi:hypothetical protein
MVADANTTRSSAFRVPSGEIVRLRSRSADLSHNWFCWAELVPNGQSSSPRTAGERRGFMVGPTSAVDVAITGVLQGTVRERVRFAAGDFVIADGQKESFAAWIGPWHAAYGWFSPNTPSTTVLGTFSGLAFVDDALGLRINSRTERLGRLLVTKRIPDVGLMQIMRGTEAAGLLPTWSGATVRAGEVWRKAVSDGDTNPHQHLLFASTSAVVIMDADPDRLKFHPDAPATPPAEADRLVLGFLEDLVELTWGR